MDLYQNYKKNFLSCLDSFISAINKEKHKYLKLFDSIMSEIQIFIICCQIVCHAFAKFCFYEVLVKLLAYSLISKVRAVLRLIIY